MRKELQKVKEEIIEGEVVFYFKHLFWRHHVSWKGPCVGREGGRGSAPDPCPLFPSSVCPGAEEAGFPLTTGPGRYHISFLHTPPVTPLSLPQLGIGRRLHRNASSLLPVLLGKFQRGVASLAPRPHPYWLLIGWGGPHPLLPLVLPLCHPLGAGSSAGDVPINPKGRGKEGGNFTFPCSRFTLTLNAFEFLFFKEKNIYIFRLGGEREILFLFGFDKIGTWGVFKCCAPRLVPSGAAI